MPIVHRKKYAISYKTDSQTHTSYAYSLYFKNNVGTDQKDGCGEGLPI